MGDHSAKVTAVRLGLTIAVFLTALATPILAQTRPSQPSTVTNEERVRQMDQSRREWQLRNLGSEPANTAIDPKRVQAITAELEQNFKRILTLHNEIVRAISADKPLDNDFISDTTAEIKKRAGRLQSALALHEPDGEQNPAQQTEFNAGQMKDRLIVLCKLIKSFVTNPVIETPGTFSAEGLSKARHDLERVIELSDSLRKSADRLKKNVIQ